MSEKLKKMATTIVLTIAVLCTAQNVSAATVAKAPYGYSWVDDSNGNKHIQFYEYTKNTYMITRIVIIKNKNVYS